MSDFKPLHFRIFSLVTKGHIIHVGDALSIDRIHLDLYTYKKGQGTTAHVEMYLPTHEARLIFADLSTCKLQVNGDGLYTEIWSGTVRNGTPHARVSGIGATDANKPAFIEVMNCDGQKLPAGAIKPKKGAKQTRIRMLLDWRTARKLSLAVLEHLQAWSTNTYQARITQDTWTPEPNSKGNGKPSRDSQASDLPPMPPVLTKALAKWSAPPAQLATIETQVRRALHDKLPRAAIADIIIQAGQTQANLVQIGDAIVKSAARNLHAPNGQITGKPYTRPELVARLQVTLQEANRLQLAGSQPDTPLWEWAWSPNQIIAFGRPLVQRINQASQEQ